MKSAQQQHELLPKSFTRLPADLPADLLGRILGYLNLASRACLRQTCHSLENAIRCFDVNFLNSIKGDDDGRDGVGGGL
jgi:hypothetical protein